MKKLIKKIIGLGLVVAVALTLCVTASAKTEYYTGNSGYKLQFKISASVSTLAGAAYLLNVEATELGAKPYYYPSLYVNAVLYGTDSTNSTNSKTFTNAVSGNISVSRGVGDCSGRGYGSFRAYGNTAYGDVSGSVYVP